VHGNNDTIGAAAAVGKLAAGLSLSQAADVLEVIGAVDAGVRERAYELGGTLAVTLMGRGRIVFALTHGWKMLAASFFLTLLCHQHSKPNCGRGFDFAGLTLLRIVKRRLPTEGSPTQFRFSSHLRTMRRSRMRLPAG
jgi:hypothetical protein